LNTTFFKTFKFSVCATKILLLIIFPIEELYSQLEVLHSQPRNLRFQLKHLDHTNIPAIIQNARNKAKLITVLVEMIILETQPKIRRNAAHVLTQLSPMPWPSEALSEAISYLRKNRILRKRFPNNTLKIIALAMVTGLLTSEEPTTRSVGIEHMAHREKTVEYWNAIRQNVFWKNIQSIWLELDPTAREELVLLFGKSSFLGITFEASQVLIGRDSKQNRSYLKKQAVRHPTKYSFDLLRRRIEDPIDERHFLSTPKTNLFPLARSTKFAPNRSSCRTMHYRKLRSDTQN